MPQKTGALTCCYLQPSQLLRFWVRGYSGWLDGSILVPSYMLVVLCTEALIGPLLDKRPMQPGTGSKGQMRQYEAELGECMEMVSQRLMKTWLK